MGSDLKQRFLDSLRYTWNSLNEFARAHRPTPAQVEAEVDRVLQEQFTRQDDSVETESTGESCPACFLWVHSHMASARREGCFLWKSEKNTSYFVPCLLQPKFFMYSYKAFHFVLCSISILQNNLM